MIARLLGLTERRLQQLAKDGIIQKSGRGRYPLAGSVRGYINYLQSQIDGGKDFIDYRIEKARRERASAEKTEFDLAVAKRQFMHVSVFEGLLERFANIASSRFDAIRSRLKVKYPDLTAAQIDGISKEIADARNAIAELRPPFDRPAT